MNINKIIDTSPGKMARISQLAEEERCTYGRMKEGLKRIEAKTYLFLKAENEKLNVKLTIKDLEAEVTMSSEVYAARLDLIEQESKHRKLEAEYKAWEEALNAGKCLAKLKMAEMKLG